MKSAADSDQLTDKRDEDTYRMVSDCLDPVNAIVGLLKRRGVA